MPVKYCPFSSRKCDNLCALYYHGQCAFSYPLKAAKELDGIKKTLQEMALRQGCEVELESEGDAIPHD